MDLSSCSPLVARILAPVLASRGHAISLSQQTGANAFTRAEDAAEDSVQGLDGVLPAGDAHELADRVLELLQQDAKRLTATEAKNTAAAAPRTHDIDKGQKALQRMGLGGPPTALDLSTVEFPPLGSPATPPRTRSRLTPQPATSGPWPSANTTTPEKPAPTPQRRPDTPSATSSPPQPARRSPGAASEGSASASKARSSDDDALQRLARAHGRAIAAHAVTHLDAHVAVLLSLLRMAKDATEAGATVLPSRAAAITYACEALLAAGRAVHGVGTAATKAMLSAPGVQAARAGTPEAELRALAQQIQREGQLGQVSADKRYDTVAPGYRPPSAARTESNATTRTLSEIIANLNILAARCEGEIAARSAAGSAQWAATDVEAVLEFGLDATARVAPKHVPALASRLVAHLLQASETAQQHRLALDARSQRKGADAAASLERRMTGGRGPGSAAGAQQGARRGGQKRIEVQRVQRAAPAQRAALGQGGLGELSSAARSRAVRAATEELRAFPEPLRTHAALLLALDSWSLTSAAVSDMVHLTTPLVAPWALPAAGAAGSSQPQLSASLSQSLRRLLAMAPFLARFGGAIAAGCAHPALSPVQLLRGHAERLTATPCSEAALQALCLAIPYACAFVTAMPAPAIDAPAGCVRTAAAALIAIRESPALRPGHEAFSTGPFALRCALDRVHAEFTRPENAAGATSDVLLREGFESLDKRSLEALDAAFAAIGEQSYRLLDAAFVDECCPRLESARRATVVPAARGTASTTDASSTRSLTWQRTPAPVETRAAAWVRALRRSSDKRQLELQRALLDSYSTQRDVASQPLKVVVDHVVDVLARNALEVALQSDASLQLVRCASAVLRESVKLLRDHAERAVSDAVLKWVDERGGRGGQDEWLDRAKQDEDMLESLKGAAQKAWDRVMRDGQACRKDLTMLVVEGYERAAEDLCAVDARDYVLMRITGALEAMLPPSLDVAVKQLTCHIAADTALESCLSRLGPTARAFVSRHLDRLDNCSWPEVQQRLVDRTRQDDWALSERPPWLWGQVEAAARDSAARGVQVVDRDIVALSILKFVESSPEMRMFADSGALANLLHGVGGRKTRELPPAEPLALPALGAGAGPPARGHVAGQQLPSAGGAARNDDGSGLSPLRARILSSPLQPSGGPRAPRTHTPPRAVRGPGMLWGSNTESANDQDANDSGALSRDSASPTAEAAVAQLMTPVTAAREASVAPPKPEARDRIAQLVAERAACPDFVERLVEEHRGDLADAEDDLLVALRACPDGARGALLGACQAVLDVACARAGSAGAGAHPMPRLKVLLEVHAREAGSEPLSAVGWL